MGEKCYYGCGREGKYLFQNGRLCCEKSYHKCPAVREKQKQLMLEKHKDSHTQMMKKLVQKGKRRCKYCNEIAHFWLASTEDEDIFCCQPKARLCPGFRSFMTDVRKKVYKDNPEYLEFQRNNVKQIAKREDVKQKKSDAMKILHNNGCEKCVTFQKNYRKGIKEARKRAWNKWYKEAVEVWGFNPEEMKTKSYISLYQRCQRARKKSGDINYV